MGMIWGNSNDFQNCVLGNMLIDDYFLTLTVNINTHLESKF